MKDLTLKFRRKHTNQRALTKGLKIVFHKKGMKFDNSTPNPSQALYLNILGSVAEFERQMIKERQREGHPPHQTA